MSLYDDLGLPPDASPEDIEAAYRKAAKAAHPDGGGSAEDFHRVQRAALILRDPVARDRYDREGTTEDQPDTSAAVAVLVGAFREAILESAATLARADIAGLAKKKIAAKISEAKADREKGKLGLARLDDALDRLTHKGEQPDFVAKMLREQRAEIERHMAVVDRQQGQAEEALELANSYDWRRDETEWEGLTFVRLGDLPGGINFGGIKG